MAKKAAAVPSVFDTAPTVDAPRVPLKEKAKRDDKVRVSIKDVAIHAALTMIEKAIKTLKGTVEAPIKDKMLDYFVEKGIALKARPENFRGVDADDNNLAEASCELRVRGAGSPLEDDEVVLLQKLGIEVTEVTEVVVVAAQPERFIINPKVFEDQALMKKLSEKLAGVTTSDGQAIILKQAAVPAVVKNVADEAVVNQVFAKGINDGDTLKSLLRVVCVTGVKSVLKIPDISKAFEFLAKAGLKLDNSKG